MQKILAGSLRRFCFLFATLMIALGMDREFMACTDGEAGYRCRKSLRVK
jgi:hypothetical protein